MTLSCIWEHNGSDTLLYCADLPGVYARGATLDEAKEKLPLEANRYCRWAALPVVSISESEIAYEKASSLNIRDADSDVIFPQELTPLSMKEYQYLKSLALKSASDFQTLYDALPDKERTVLAPRKTFYGAVPLTGEEMYQHTKNVNAYYFAEIGVDADNDGSIWECRQQGFDLLELQTGFLCNRVLDGSYGEQWSLRKVLRRFLWHDRIHAKAMYRMAVKTFGAGCVPDIFFFDR